MLFDLQHTEGIIGDEVYDVPLGEGAVLVDRHDGETLYASDRAAPHEDGE